MLIRPGVRERKGCRVRGRGVRATRVDVSCLEECWPRELHFFASIVLKHFPRGMLGVRGSDAEDRPIGGRCDAKVREEDRIRHGPLPQRRRAIF